MKTTEPIRSHKIAKHGWRAVDAKIQFDQTGQLGSEKCFKFVIRRPITMTASQRKSPERGRKVKRRTTGLPVTQDQAAQTVANASSPFLRVSIAYQVIVEVQFPKGR